MVRRPTMARAAPRARASDRKKKRGIRLFASRALQPVAATAVTKANKSSKKKEREHATREQAAPSATRKPTRPSLLKKRDKKKNRPLWSDRRRDPLFFCALFILFFHYFIFISTRLSTPSLSDVGAFSFSFFSFLFHSLSLSFSVKSGGRGSVNTEWSFFSQCDEEKGAASSASSRGRNRAEHDEPFSCAIRARLCRHRSAQKTEQEMASRAGLCGQVDAMLCGRASVPAQGP